jgi:hypothetical protein
LCLVAPEQKIVIAAAASFKSMSRLQVLLDLIFECIFDALGTDPLPDSGHTASLQAMLDDWSTSALPALQPRLLGKGRLPCSPAGTGSAATPTACRVLVLL